MNNTMSHAEPETPQKAGGLKRIYNAFFYSLEGIGSTLKHEAAFRQEMLLAAVMVPVAAFLPGLELVARAFMVGSVFLVLIVELLNSAIEWTIDYISIDRHPFAKRAKDMGSAAVLLSLFNCAIIWALALWDAFGQAAG